MGSLVTEYARTGVMAQGSGAPYKVEGIGGDKVSSTIWFDTIDEWRQATDRVSMMMARRLAREEGILVGGSAGLNVAVALDLARELDDPDAYVVTILCDTGERYLSKVFNDDWMQENQLLDRPQATVEQLLLQRRPSSAPALVQVAPAAAVRQALNLMSSWEVSQIPVIENGEAGRRSRGVGADDARAGAALAARPSGARGHGPALPGGRAHLPDRPAGTDAYP